MVERALISVTDKTGLEELGRFLVRMHVEILSTGRTRTFLTNIGINSIEVADYIEFPEIMNGKLKTLHPKIHGGLLGRRGIDDYIMTAYEILPIDLLVVNLYDFEGTISQSKTTIDQAIENIDIGRPAMLRSAAKNFENVVVLSDPSQYDDFMLSIDEHGEIPYETRLQLAREVFTKTYKYDRLITNYLSKIITE